MFLRAFQALGTVAVLAACSSHAARSPERALLPTSTAESPPAEPDEESFAWKGVTGSPQRGSITDVGDRALMDLCGAPDAALGRTAARLARRQAERLPPLEMAEINFALRAEGAPYVWPRAWSLQGAGLNRDDIAGRMQHWLGTFDDGGERRCGIALVSEAGAIDSVAAVALDALADLDPVPTRVHTGQWVTIGARLLVPADDAKVIVLGPALAPHGVPTTLDDGRVRATFSPDRPGAWVVQVLATVHGGPRPVLEAVVHADVPPPSRFAATLAPGEEAAQYAPSAEQALVRMVNAARAEQGLRALRNDVRLNRIAVAQAQAMRAAGQVGHNVGLGDPRLRVEHAGLDVMIAGENVAHAATIRRAHRALWASPSHRANILQGAFDSMGVGVVPDSDGSLWVCESFADFR